MSNTTINQAPSPVLTFFNSVPMKINALEIVAEEELAEILFAHVGLDSLVQIAPNRLEEYNFIEYMLNKIFLNND